MTLLWLIVWAIFDSPPLDFAGLEQGHLHGWLLVLVIVVAVDLWPFSERADPPTRDFPQSARP